ncbi:hypothetical protein C4544_04945 [candidate division WS5 bacterium]|uniref:Transposase n=1 Tax=candidate division WS5 bacterium TaxID=2093353 RepID=A0A419DBU2_9BACT|nr:MAG: hypothetical protein C4544_04945 [candidate division WS5 bacterium]
MHKNYGPCPKPDGCGRYTLYHYSATKLYKCWSCGHTVTDEEFEAGEHSVSQGAEPDIVPTLEVGSP